MPMKNTYCALGALYDGDNPKYFERALVSVLNQTKRIPICLVLDGPISPALETVVERHADDIEHIIRLQKNEGLGRALQFSTEAMSSHFDYAIRFDSDDINHENRFELLIDAIEKENFDLLGSHMFECNGDKLEHVINERKVPLTQKDIVSRIRWRNPFNHPSVVFRIEAVIAAGNYENVPYFEDWYLWAKMVVNKAKVGNVDRTLVNFRFDERMLERRRGLQYLKHEFYFYKKLRGLEAFGKTTFTCGSDKSSY